MDVSIREGDIINDAYKVERVIGSGGMAVVVAALDLRSPRRVAIKVLFRRAASSPEVLKRFEREQQVVRRLSGEHVARLLDSGLHRNAPYMVMEYLQGSNLAETLRVQGPLPVEQAVDYVLQACEAVAEAHALDIVHRDLKPGNLFLTHRPDGSPCIKVLDFGIAKILAADRAAEESTLTKTTTVMGSPFYMSPEQVISPRSVGRSTDIWSLGVILYELLAGKIPFAAKSPEKVCSRVLNDPPDSLRAQRPYCPEKLEEAIVKCLQRQPKNRHPDVAAFAFAIAPFASEASRDAPARIASILANPNAAAQLRDSSHDLVASRDADEPPEAPTVYRPTPRRSGSRKPILVVAFGVAMLGIGFAGGFLLRAKTSPPPTVPEPMATTAAPVLSVVTSLPSASSEPVAEPDLSAVLAQIPIEMDLDDEAARAAAHKRAELRRKREREAAAASSSSSDNAADASAPPADTAVVPAVTASAPSPSSTPATPTPTTPSPSRPNPVRSAPTGEPLTGPDSPPAARSAAF